MWEEAHTDSFVIWGASVQVLAGVRGFSQFGIAN
jgi:hypothetical protein